MALVKCWNSIKINTNKMFTSTIEGLFVFSSLQWGDPFLLLRENTGEKKSSSSVRLHAQKIPFK